MGSMISAAAIRRRLQQGDTLAVLGAEIGLTADAFRKRAARLGITSTGVLGRHRKRPPMTVEQCRERSRRWREAARERRGRGL